VIVHALIVASESKVKTLLISIHEDSLGFDFFVEDGANGEGVGDFAEGDLDGFFVVRNLDAFGDFGNVNAGFGGTGLENWDGDLRREAPGFGGSGKEVRKFGGGGAGGTSQQDAREKSGASRADVG